VLALLPLVDYVKMDMRNIPLSTLMKLAPRFRQEKKSWWRKSRNARRIQELPGPGLRLFPGLLLPSPSS
jgi:c-di-GMP-related signal transduction protein